MPHEVGYDYFDAHVRAYLESTKKWYEVVWRHPVLRCLEIIHQDDAWLP